MKRLAFVIAVATGLAVTGCTGFSHISKTYVSLTPQVVTISCNDPYEVYDQRKQRRMLIVSNAVREFTGCGIGDRYADRDPGETRAARFRLAARTYLDETVREDCRITGETVFTDLQTEFVYACGAPIEPRTAKVPRLPGRTNPGIGLR
ncbi:hypothetical protein FV232_07100 [Methylobacterium sp. WL30]|uniref:hypothetical protein n=1 Tax=unclassified Methylobacterium TaxID=2615210 RepID=UPI0011C70E5B|nr:MULTISPECIES: hypothetical protein [unclassified Methylobacterium]TXN40968.1 hypothetical protein FV225_04195 [Methylobacterium sp. WL93]TXN51005.1 hypothetical protein FV227_09300 [Methylobacterium sp. WL119]TXN68996.1 hypothetical protein FV232_07100 [Methylobacterium sp. WL30]